MINYDSPDVFKQVCEEAEKLTNKKINEINIDFLVDLLLEMANDFRDSVIEWSATNVSHRLKLELSSNPYPRNNWKNTVERTIDSLQLKFKRNPSLKKWLESNLDEVWDLALKEYKRSCRVFTDLPKTIPYDKCPWTVDELLIYIDV